MLLQVLSSVIILCVVLYINRKAFRFVLVLIIPLLITHGLAYLAEFSGKLDITDLSKGIELSIKNPVWTPEISNQLFKVVTKIEIPLFYQVSALNNVFVNLEATQPQTTPAPTIVKIGEIEIPFEKTRTISAGFVQINSAED